MAYLRQAPIFVDLFLLTIFQTLMIMRPLIVVACTAQFPVADGSMVHRSPTLPRQILR